jgi:armadillo repeat-containing protein 7
LANFAYDPFNYAFMRQVVDSTPSHCRCRFLVNIFLNYLYCSVTLLLFQLNVLELFLDCITEPNERLVEFGIGGICNSCVGKQ